MMASSGTMPMRGPPGQAPRPGASMRGSMGRGDYGECLSDDAMFGLLCKPPFFLMKKHGPLRAC